MSASESTGFAAPTDESVAGLVERLRERTAMRYMGDCKCGKCQLVPHELIGEAMRAIEASEARVHQFSVPLAMFVKRIQANGEWNDGCFYYRGTSASDLEKPLRLAHDAFVGKLAGIVLLAKHNAEIEKEHEATFDRAEASEARATALEGERARDERVAEMAYDAMSAALKLCQVHVSELLAENEERQKLRLSIFSALEMPAGNLGNIARRAKERREAGAKL